MRIAPQVILNLVEIGHIAGRWLFSHQEIHMAEHDVAEQGTFYNVVAFRDVV
ncbi:hypothetical protein D3C76_1732360 [compost metagenome]